MTRRPLLRAWARAGEAAPQTLGGRQFERPQRVVDVAHVEVGTRGHDLVSFAPERRGVSGPGALLIAQIGEIRDSIPVGHVPEYHPPRAAAVRMTLLRSRIVSRCPREEAEDVVRSARSPFPRHIGEDKLLAWGRGSGGRLLQVIFVLDEDGTVFVIHGRELSPLEKRRQRRGKGNR